jgi:hypothetical protein
LVNRLTEPKLLSLSDFKGEGESEASLGFPALVQNGEFPIRIQCYFGELGADEVARKPGRKGGRKRQMTDNKIKSPKKLLASGVPPRDVASNLGVSVPTLYRWIPASTLA